MSDRLEKLYTLTDIENLEGAPVTIEAGGLIKDNKTGRVIARMYLKNCSEKTLTSVLVGFRPRGENGRTISGMRDYLYDASGVTIGEIFGDQTGILFDNNETKAFSADVEEVDFEDGEYWDAIEARKEAEKLKLIVPEEKEPPEQNPAMWEKPADKASAPAVWEGEVPSDEPHSAEIYGAVIAENKSAQQAEEEPEQRQLEHEERPVLEEQTDAFRKEQEKAVIELEGPSENEGPVIELGGPVSAEEPAAEEVAEEAAEEAEKPVEEESAVEEPAEEEPAAEETLAEEAVEAPVEEVVEEEPAEEEITTGEELEAETAAEPEEEPEQPSGPVRLADMYGGVSVATTLGALAAAYGMKQAKPEIQDIPEVDMSEPEAPEEAPVEEPAAEEAEPEEAAEAPAEEPAAEEAEPEEAAEAPAEEPVAEAETETEAAAEAEPEASEAQKPEDENPWANYSSDYAPPLGAIRREAPAEKVEPEEQTAEETPSGEAVPAEEPAEEQAAVPEEAEVPAEEVSVNEEATVSEEAQVEEAAEEVAVEDLAEEHIPSIEETIELPKAEAAEKSADDAEKIIAAAAATEEAVEEAAVEKTAEEAAVEEEAASSAKSKADVVFAAESEVIPSIIDNKKEKALTGEDHSGRNLLNIVVFGGIALIILLVILIKM